MPDETEARLRSIETTLLTVATDVRSMREDYAQTNQRLLKVEGYLFDPDKGLVQRVRENEAAVSAAKGWVKILLAAVIGGVGSLWSFILGPSGK